MTMSEQHQSFFPQVGQADREANVFRDSVEKTAERWKKFAQSNPELARELTLRAYTLTYFQTGRVGDLNRAQELINFAVYTAEVLAKASGQDAEDPEIVPSDVVADEVQRLSSELDDDPPAASLSPTQPDS